MAGEAKGSRGPRDPRDPRGARGARGPRGSRGRRGALAAGVAETNCLAQASGIDNVTSSFSMHATRRVLYVGGDLAS